MESLRDKIEHCTAKVGIIGLGYVGLPIVRAFIDCGFQTIGFDVNAHKVKQLQAGESYIQHVSSTDIQKWLNEDVFHATDDMRMLSEADVLLICVPTPLTESREPDLSFVRSTARCIAATLREGQLIVLESTTYPGTTRNVVLPILEQSGFVAGQDFFLGYSPEREDPGNPNYTTGDIPKVVGGTDDVSTELTNALYSKAVVQTVPVSNCEVAEACKIVENIYRSVNIAMVNELKMLLSRLDIDIWEVIEAAKTKPFGFQAFYPGPGLGGHCIPIDPFYLSWVARKNGMSARFIELAGEVNTMMPEYVVTQVADALNEAGKPVKGSKIVILGVAYKRDVDDPRESPSFRLMELLLQRGAELSYNDPFIPVLPSMRQHDLPPMESEELTEEYLSDADCVLIATDHTTYDWDFIVRHSKVVVDTRNATGDVVQGREKISKA